MNKNTIIYSGNQEEIKNCAIQAFLKQEVIIAPFDTVYGFICDPFSEIALKKIFSLKDRHLEQTIGLAVSDLDELKKYAHLDENQEQFIKSRVPGPYTFILKSRTDRISSLCQKNNTIALRIPNSPLILELIKSLGGIIAQTSANKSGQDNCYSVQAILAQFSENEAGTIGLIIDGGEIPQVGASEIIDLTENTPKEIER